MTSKAFENVTKLNALGRSVKEFGAKGDGVTDDTAAFAAAFAASPVVYVPEGIYPVDASNAGGCRITSGSNYHLYGEGEKSVVKRFSYGPAKCSINFDSGSATAFIDDIHISNIKFLGDVQTLGHNETFGHMLILDGVRRVLIEKCYFEGPRSDAILFGSGPGGPTSERHNFDLVVRNCVFNGVVFGADGGRNAISVIDCDGCLIEGNSFRDWSRNDMPGTIDFEADFSFGVIKNVRVANNKFTNTAGTAGHIAFACDNIPTANQQNWVITGNEFSGASGTSGAAIYLLTEKVTPSVPSTVGQNIVIANNTATDCKWFVDKFKGSVNNITIANNVVNFSGSAQGAVRFADGTFDYTLTDAIITGNSFITTNNIPISITDNIVNLMFSNNILRGATQAHMRFGLSGGNTTNIVVADNQLLGTPSNFLCQHDATTTNPETNLWRNNRAPTTVSNNFRGYAVDMTGGVQNQFTTSTQPQNFPYGETVAYLNSVNVGIAILDGVGKTFRYSAVNNTNIHQVFTPVYDVTYEKSFFIRKAVDATTWGAWSHIRDIAGNLTIDGQLTVSSAADNQVVLARPGLGAPGYATAGLGSVRSFDTDNNVSVAKYTGVSDGSTAGSVALQTLISGTLGTRLQVDFVGNTVPGVNNAYSLGDTSMRWTELFATSGVINTSDAREKQNIQSLSEAEKAVARRLKNLLRTFKYEHAVAKKGDGARTHVGIVAQDVKDAFAAEDLDADKYGMFCYDKWNATETVFDENGDQLIAGREAGDLYSVRYEELLAFIVAAI